MKQIPALQKQIAEKEKVIESLSERIGSVTEIVLGSPSSINATHKVAAEVRQELDLEPGEGLIDPLKKLHRRNQDLATRLVQKDEEIQLARTDQQKIVEQKEELEEGHTAEINAFEGKIADIEAQRVREKQLADEDAANIREQHSRALADLNEQLTEKSNIIDQRDQTIKEREDTIIEQNVKLAELRRKLTPIVEIKNLADGKVVFIPKDLDNDLCYIDIGRGSGIKEGQTFNVYPKDGIQQKHQRGSIEVVDVQETFSVCRVTKGSVEVEDNVANIAFDKTRRYRFVVVGNFDLTFEEVPSPEGRERLIEAIKLFGGIVDDTLDIQADFLVVGHQPTEPIPPGVGATPNTEEAYKRKKEDYDNFQKFQEIANTLNVKRINTKQFVAFTGYVPPKRPN